MFYNVLSKYTYTNIRNFFKRFDASSLCTQNYCKCRIIHLLNLIYSVIFKILKKFVILITHFIFFYNKNNWENANFDIFKNNCPVIL